MWSPLGNSRKVNPNLSLEFLLVKNNNNENTTKKGKMCFRDVISFSDRRGGRVSLGSPRDSLSGNYPATEGNWNVLCCRREWQHLELQHPDKKRRDNQADGERQCYIMGWQAEGREKMGRGKSWQETLRQPAQLLENEIMPQISNAQGTAKERE